eukprot:TRINITY_DN10634_c0_g1_i1.p1 TRINITY_DN10634_c0_g1~~TRINITY_DN10634_c0_g1_i1.p1  ORF type:complete len:113 (-),score=10.98 TRINITY_DN10634_c0_g1_i1:39-377(-)
MSKDLNSWFIGKKLVLKGEDVPSNTKEYVREEQLPHPYRTCPNFKSTMIDEDGKETELVHVVTCEFRQGRNTFLYDKDHIIVIHQYEPYNITRYLVVGWLGSARNLARFYLS